MKKVFFLLIIFLSLNYFAQEFTSNDLLYTGIGFHKGINEDQGSLFAVGINLGVNKKKYKNIFFDANVHFDKGSAKTYQEDGLKIYSNADFYIRLTNHLGVSVCRRIGVTFEALTAGFNLKHYGLRDGIKDIFTEEASSKIKTHGIGIRSQNQTYFNVAKGARPNESLQVLL